MRIPQHKVDEIHNRADIVEIISDFVALKKDGANYKGLSPFQQEKTPSFVVSPSKGIFKCFSSGHGGNAISFLMKAEGLSYRESLEHVAKKYGILIEVSESEKEQYNKRDKLVQINQFAADFFVKSILDGANPGMAAASKRGLEMKTMMEFGIGYADDEWHSFHHSSRFEESDLLQLGLLSQSEKGKIFDRYRNRLMFPIHDTQGDIVGFGGRDLTGEANTAKYINSPDSTLYQKSYLLYNLHRAKKHILKLDEVFLTEGYMDVVTPWQHGVKNIVASCGTALTVEQAQLLKRYTSNVIIMYDHDPAGLKAAGKACQVLLQAGLDPKVIMFPPDYDPDQYFREYGQEEFMFLSKRSVFSWFDYTRHYLNYNVEEPTSPKHVSKVIKALVKLIKLLPDALDRELYFKKIKEDYEIALTENQNGKISISQNQLSSDTQNEGGSQANQADNRNLLAPVRTGSGESHTDIQLEEKRKYDDYLRLIKAIGIPVTDDFRRASDGSIEINYFDVKGNQYRITKSGKKVSATRTTGSLEKKPNAVYIPPLLRTDHKFDNMPLILIQDEITAYILSELGIPALGLNNPLGFMTRQGKGTKEAHILIRQTLKTHGFSSVLYVMDHKGWTLPQGNQLNGDPYEHINVAANAEHAVQTLCLLQETFRKDNIDVVHLSESLKPDTPFWMERFILDIVSDFGIMKGDSRWTGDWWKNILQEMIEPSDDSIFTIHRHLSSKTQYVFEEYMRVNEVNRFLSFHGINRIGNRFQFRKNIYEYDPISGTADVVSDSEDQLEVFEQYGAYYARERGGSKRISNFIMKCLMEVKGDEPFGLYELKTRRGHQANLLFYEKDILTVNDFKMKIRQSYGEFIFLGNSTQLQHIQEQIIVGTEKGQSLSEKLGIFKPRKSPGETVERDPFYIWGNGILDIKTGEFKEVNEEGLVEHQGKKYFLEAFSSYNLSEYPEQDFEYEMGFFYTDHAIDFNEWRDLFMKVHGWNGHIGFSFLLMALNWDIFQSKYGRAPFLSLQGQRGTGKGVLMESLEVFFGKLVIFNLQTASSTYAFNNHVSRYRNAIVMFNEFTPSTQDDYYTNSPKAWYDGEARRKGNMRSRGKTTAELPNSAQIFTGQESFYEHEASVSRGIICDFTKTKFTAEEMLLKNQLNEMEAYGLTSMTAYFLKNRTLIEEHLSTVHQSLEVKLRKLCKTFNPSISPDARLFFNWSCVISPLLIFIDHKVIEYHLSKDEIINYAAQRIIAQALKMEKEGTLSLFFEFIMAEYGAPRGIDHQDVFVIEGKIRIRFATCYPKFAVWLRRSGKKIESARRDDIHRKLTEHPAFVKEANAGMWIGYRKNESGRVRLDNNGKPILSKTKGIEMDLAQLDIDLPEIDWLGNDSIPEDDDRQAEPEVKTEDKEKVPF